MTNMFLLHQMQQGSLVYVKDKMILGISGTQGTGKTTILQGASALVAVDKSQLAREAQKALGWDRLSLAEESEHNMWALQSAILTAMRERDERIRATGTLHIVERTPADMWAYTLLWCQRLKIDAGDHLGVGAYRKECESLIAGYSAIVMVPQVTAVPFVADPHRADLASRDFVEDRVRSFLEDSGVPFYVMQETSRDGRIAEIEAIINHHNSTYN